MIKSSKLSWTFLLIFLAGCVGQTEFSDVEGTPPTERAAAIWQASSALVVGVVVEEKSGDTQPGAVEGLGPAGGSEMPDRELLSWLIYRDKTFGFSFAYPDLYMILDEVETLSQISPKLVRRVRLLDKELAESETAQLQPPNFSVEIFSNDSALPLDRWIRENTPSQGVSRQANIGGIACVLLTLPTLMAPNEFYFCAHHNYVYRIIVLSPYETEMLGSFQFGP